MSEKKKGFLARRAVGTARYVGRRFGNQFINKVGRDSLSKGAQRAKATLTPSEVDPDDFRAGLDGRYSDGGVKRFRDVMRTSNVSDDDLAGLAKSRRRAGIMMFVAAGGFLLLGSWMMINAEGFNQVVFGLVTALMSFLFVTIGINHDFSRWQIEQKRFGGFKEYLGTKPVLASKFHHEVGVGNKVAPRADE